MQPFHDTQYGIVSLVTPIHSPWLDTLLEAVNQVQNDLLLISPYLKKEKTISKSDAAQLRI